MFSFKEINFIMQDPIWWKIIASEKSVLVKLENKEYNELTWVWGVKNVEQQQSKKDFKN